ncbi:MAG TPA: VWA domain-containing protein, partial [Rhodopila sp.]|nr:VWA domain-containing protein [Rhodopila sp.]
DLLDTGAPRRIGGLLGNDLGQMRVQFNARTHVVEPAYRDDGLGMWDFPDQAETPPELLEMMVEAARLRQEAGEGRGEGEPDLGSAPARARPVAAEPGGVLLARYPEWDRAQGEERPEWTSVFEHPAPLGDTRPLDAALDAAADLRHRINRLVRAARPGRPQRLKHQPDGMDLDMDAVLDAEVMREAGELPGDRLYRMTALQTRDLATLVLVDVSESTRFGGVLDIERVAVALLAEAMSRLGDPFALMAFASNGREQVRLTRIKGFSESFAAPARARLAGLRPGLSTRLGAALRHAGAELAGVRSFRRLVLVLTDGEPSDIDVADPLDLVEDGRRAVLGLRARGIDSFAVVLGAHGAETAGRMFGRSGRVALRRLDDLPARLSDLYFRLSRR